MKQQRTWRLDVYEGAEKLQSIKATRLREVAGVLAEHRMEAGRSVWVWPALRDYERTEIDAKLRGE